LHERNRRWLAERDGMVVAVSPQQLADAVANFKPGQAGPS
jgi:hypothetical protein